MRHRWTARLLVLFVVASALLYPCLLPLWEGFDEPFHYAYVQWLVVRKQVPELHRSLLSAEIWQSLQLMPVSETVHRNLPETTTFGQWAAMSKEQRSEKLQKLRALSPSLRTTFEPRPNYEAHQPPLAYALLGGIDYLAAGLPLWERVLVLRLTLSLCSAALLLFCSVMLARALELTPAWQLLALVLIFQTQMLWATIAHIANDWLAVPIAAGLFASIALYERNPRQVKYCAACTGLLAVGLLTKAYFLAFVPVVVIMVSASAKNRLPSLACLLIPILAAGPWYTRNWLLTGSISGTPEAAGGVGVWDALQAAAGIDWMSTAATMARSNLWTANNSFLTFSRATLNCELLLLLLAFLLAVRSGRVSKWLLASLASFGAALVYAASVSRVYTNGAAEGFSPWYGQILLAPCILICCVGLQHSGRIGRVVAACLVMLSGWICLVTYTAKLIPLYIGMQPGRATLSSVGSWWLREFTVNPDELSSLSMAPKLAVYALLALVLASSSALSLLLLARLRTLTCEFPAHQCRTGATDDFL